MGLMRSPFSSSPGCAAGSKACWPGMAVFILTLTLRSWQAGTTTVRAARKSWLACAAQPPIPYSSPSSLVLSSNWRASRRSAASCLARVLIGRASFNTGSGSVLLSAVSSRLPPLRLLLCVALGLLHPAPFFRAVPSCSLRASVLGQVRGS